MPDTTKTRPADGGSYRHTKDGYQRLDQPQKPDPGKTARRKEAAKAEKAKGKSAAKDSQSSGSNVSQLPAKGEKE